MAEIEAANRRPDAHYGFTFADAHSYTNVRRLPETVFGDFYDHLEKQHRQINSARRVEKA